ncbi:hypothetical protein L7F22_015741 [Adiantum nelumboides]|nr:hypothetical protein [Adiantum nelumboides]
MRTRQGTNVPSKYEASEEGSSNSSERSDYEPTSKKVPSKKKNQMKNSLNQGPRLLTESPSHWFPSIQRSIKQCHASGYHLDPPKHTLIEVFSRKQLSQLDLQSLAQVDLFAGNVSTGKLSALLLTFPKLNDKNSQ